MASKRANPAPVDNEGPREGHGDPDQNNLSVKKGTFMQVGTGVSMSESAFSPNKKTGTASGTNEY